VDRFAFVIRPSRQALAIGGALLVGAVWAWLAAVRSSQRVADAGFWFEPSSFESSQLSAPLTPQELKTIESVAVSEVERAFAGLRITFSDRRDATYRVRVVPKLLDLRLKRHAEVAGASRAVSGFGGQGEVSFGLLAASAIGYAPPDADRRAIVEGIGRGIGRAAVHEFAHQLLPSAAIDSGDATTYEYGAANRREQFYGNVHWGTAWPLLEKRLGSSSEVSFATRSRN
jgi:hypothetical protein